MTQDSSDKSVYDYDLSNLASSPTDRPFSRKISTSTIVPDSVNGAQSDDPNPPAIVTPGLTSDISGYWTTVNGSSVFLVDPVYIGSLNEDDPLE